MSQIMDMNSMDNMVPIKLPYQFFLMFGGPCILNMVCCPNNAISFFAGHNTNTGQKTKNDHTFHYLAQKILVSLYYNYYRYYSFM